MKYKVLFAALSVSALLCPGANAMSGSGTKDDPYQISDTNDYSAFAALVNDGSFGADGYAVLTDSLDFTGRIYPVVGTAAHPFEGHFDGSGYALKGVMISSIPVSCVDTESAVAAVGAFGFARDAEISDLHIEDAAVNVKDTSHPIRTGLLCGDYSAMNGSEDSGIFRCHADGDLTVVSASTSYAGGIVGCFETTAREAYATVSDCSAVLNADVTSKFTVYCAAIAAKASETGYLSTISLERCVGSLSLKTKPYDGKLTRECIGGIVGTLTIDSDWRPKAGDSYALYSADVPEIDRCVTLAFDATEATDGAYCGDIVGYYSDTLNLQCYAENGCRRASKYSITGIGVTTERLSDATFWNGIGYDLTAVWELTEDDGISLRKAKKAEPFVLTYADDMLTAEINAADLPHGLLIMALYDTDGRLMASKTATITEETQTLRLTVAVENVVDVRFYVLDGATFAPLADCAERTIA